MKQDCKKERLQKAFDFLYNKGIVHSVTELALKMQRSRPSVSRALNGVPEYLNDKFLVAFAQTFVGTFSLEWLETGKGEMLLPEDGKQQVVDNATNSNVDWQQVAYDTMKSQIEDLRARLEEKQIIIDSQKREIELLNMRIRGMELEMQMKGVDAYSFNIGSGMKLSAPDK